MGYKLLKKLRKRFIFYYKDGYWKVYNKKTRKIAHYKRSDIALLNMCSTFMALGEPRKYLNKVYLRDWDK